jgi:hypothetical protein
MVAYMADSFLGFVAVALVKRERPATMLLSIERLEDEAVLTEGPCRRDDLVYAY